ncbi:uncharacterized protein TNCV_3217601 [Trichonephila clavipes]|nr:uncharacterized protein TNCV_3217601 [Trichonephila clavipes]
MDFTEINSRGKRGELLGRIDRQNSRFRTAKTIIIKFGLHASFVESESAKNVLNEKECVAHPVQWLATLTAVPWGLGSNPGEDMDVCKCIVPSRHGGINSRRAASPLVRLVEEEERWEASDPSPWNYPLKLGRNRAKSYCHMYGAQGYGQRQVYI